MTLSLRPATQLDVDAVALIWREGWLDGHAGHVPDTLLEARTPSSFRERALERVADTVVAASDDRVVGFIMLRGDELEQIYVDRASRGAGVADTLIREAESRVGAAGHFVIWLAVAIGNMQARRFYERVGWRDAGPLDYQARTRDGVVSVQCRRFERDLPGTTPLLAPYVGRHLTLRNRIAMAPMTRFRADPTTGVPTPEVADYYGQRAGAGLIITEGIWPDPRGKGGPGVPGLADDAQRDGWRAVTTAVHAAGGLIFAQLWHVGRMAHPAGLPDGLHPVGASAVAAPGTVHVGGERLPTVTPEPLSLQGVVDAIQAFAASARRAIAAGFDGVELHGANGYLIQQFLADNTNLRTDVYGSDHLRFALEVVEAVCSAVGADRTAIRLSPGNSENSIVETQPEVRYRSLVRELDNLGLAYLHLSEKGVYPALADLRQHWSGTLIGNFDPPAPTSQVLGEQMLAAGHADVIAFGRLFIANPDLPARFAAGAPLAEIDRAHLYRGGPRGYTDYPSAEATQEGSMTAG